MEYFFIVFFHSEKFFFIVEKDRTQKLLLKGNSVLKK